MDNDNLEQPASDLVADTEMLQVLDDLSPATRTSRREQLLACIHGSMPRHQSLAAKIAAASWPSTRRGKRSSAVGVAGRASYLVSPPPAHWQIVTCALPRSNPKSPC